MTTELITTLTGALVGALVAAAIFFGQREQSRWQATIAMIAEFNSPQWLTIRSDAYQALCRCADPSTAMLRRMEDPSLTLVDQNKVWAVLAFYARLYTMLRGRFLVRRRILPAFGEVFFWWWAFYFSHIERATHESELKLVRRLHAWLEAEARRHGDPDILVAWHNEGREARHNMNPHPVDIMIQTAAPAAQPLAHAHWKL